MNVLITGANGFIGKHIAEQYSQQGHNVYGISLHDTNLKQLLPTIKFDTCDMLNITSIKSSIAAFSPDVVIHCAWWGGNNYRDSNSLCQFHKNVLPLIDLLEIMIDLNIPYFIGIGSSSEYGIRDYAITETEKETPFNLYGTSKLMLKLCSEKICDLNKINWLWIRPFYTYGPFDIKTRLIPKIVVSCLKSENIILNDCLSMTDYLFIDDFVDALQSLIKHNCNGVYNICDGKTHLVKNIVEQIRELTNTNSTITFDKSLNRTDFPTITWGNNEKLNEIHSNISKTNMKSGLLKTIDFYANNL